MTTVMFWTNMVEHIVVIWANLMLGIASYIQLRQLKGIK